MLGVPGAVLNQTHCFVFSTDLCFTKEETEAQKGLSPANYSQRAAVWTVNPALGPFTPGTSHDTITFSWGMDVKVRIKEDTMQREQSRPQNASGMITTQ